MHLHRYNYVLHGSCSAGSLFSLLLLLTSLSPRPTRTLGLNNGLGRTPPMGWNRWNAFRYCVNQTVIAEIADAFISTGLYKLGYEYVNLDDCWAESRNALGAIQPNPDKFWDMPGLVSYVHSKGLKFGIYSDAGNLTCAGRPGSLGYEDTDARTYAEWKVDFLKYDNCNNEGILPEKRYPVMRDALNETGRHIFYSICEWGFDNPATWAGPVGNSWRTWHDIRDDWGNMIRRAEYNDQWWSYAAPGGWNDPDVMEVGNGGMTVTEYETHFSLWCLMKAPLLMGNDLRNMDYDTHRILSNSELIAINQDRLGVQGHKVKSQGKEGLEQEVWAGPLSDGAYALLLLNKDSIATQITASWSDFGLDPLAEAKVRDLWQHKDMGTMKGSVSASVSRHGVVVYRVTPI